MVFLGHLQNNAEGYDKAHAFIIIQIYIGVFLPVGEKPLRTVFILQT